LFADPALGWCLRFAKAASATGQLLLISHLDQANRRNQKDCILILQMAQAPSTGHSSFKKSHKLIQQDVALTNTSRCSLRARLYYQGIQIQETEIAMNHIQIVVLTELQSPHWQQLTHARLRIKGSSNTLTKQFEGIKRSLFSYST
jgi:hypothetical protein